MRTNQRTRNHHRRRQKRRNRTKNHLLVDGLTRMDSAVAVTIHAAVRVEVLAAVAVEAEVSPNTLLYHDYSTSEVNLVRSVAVAAVAVAVALVLA
jgi:hypothetical protein